MKKSSLSSLMAMAFDQALLAASQGEVPVGALVFDTQSLKVVCQSHNEKEQSHNPLGHGEIIAIHKATRLLNRWRLSGCSMIVTLEPCVMCYGALIQARMDQVLWATADPKGGAETAFQLHSREGHNHFMEFAKANLGFEDKSSQLLKSFFRARRKSSQAPSCQ